MTGKEYLWLLFIRHVHAICQMDGGGRGGEHCFGLERSQSGEGLEIPLVRRRRRFT